MKRVMILCMAAICLMSWAAIVKGQETEERSEIVSTIAKVESLDPTTRMVILKNTDGGVFSVIAGESVTNFSQLNPGDRVAVRYQEGRVLQMAKPDQQLMSAPAPVQAGPGRQPVTMSGIVQIIDPRRSMVTLKGSEGQFLNVKVGDPNLLESLKYGDRLSVTYTDATATSIEKLEG